MNTITTFSNSEFGNVRTLAINGEPHFIGKDVALILGYSNPRKAIIDHVDNEDKGVTKCDTLGGTQDLTIINESGLYSLILSSKLPNAKRFKRWITHEVIPSIRKTGGYIANQENMSDAELMAKALLVAQRQIEQRNQIIEQQKTKIEQDKPKVIFASAVETSKTSILVGDLAKLIKQNGVEIGQKRLFAWLRENGYLIKTGASYNMPTQRSVERGLFEIKESTISNPDGSVRITRTPKVTGAGQVYFINLFLNKKELEEI